MSRYRAGSTALDVKIRLKIAGWWMVATNIIAAKATKNYQQAYKARYGQPTLGQLLDQNL